MKVREAQACRYGRPDGTQDHQPVSAAFAVLRAIGQVAQLTGDAYFCAIGIGLCPDGERAVAAPERELRRFCSFVLGFSRNICRGIGCKSGHF